MKLFKQAVLSITIFALGFAAFETSSVMAESLVTRDSSKTDSLAIARLFETVENSLLNGLKSDNKDLVDSNLYHLVIFKTDYPEFQSEVITKELAKIIRDESSPHLRYKAQLALTYFQHQEEFTNLFGLKTLIGQNEFIKIFFRIDGEVRSGNITVANTPVNL